VHHRHVDCECMRAVYASIMYHFPLARLQFLFDVIRWSITACLMILSLILHSQGSASDIQDVIILGVAVLIELAVWIISRAIFRSWYKYPIDLDLMQARWGVWVMIVVGEAVIQMLYRNVDIYELQDTYIFSLAAFALMFSLAMQYYDACQVEWFEHALTKSAAQGVAWIWLHIPMTQHLFRVGVSFNVVLESIIEHTEVPAINIRLMSTSLGVCTCILTLIRITNSNWKSVTYWQIGTYLFRFVLSGIQLSVPLWGVTEPLSLILTHTALSIALFNVTDIVHDLNLAVKKEVIFSNNFPLKLRYCVIFVMVSSCS
jgi:hypothetical protein